MKYNHKKEDKKWQKYWENKGIYQNYGKLKKFYVLDMFPYPSGVGLHVGHPKGYIATDVVARLKLLQGYSVLHPMGWDAFGLPAENYAIQNKVHPKEAVEKNVKVFKKQLQKIGFTYDWEREINTTDPKYYKWTQWIFLKLFEYGLAYEADEPINWCPSCKTGLANEDLEDGKCERCGSVVEQKKMRQWKLRMTAYAERLLEDLDKEKLDWEESIKIQQRNWIGRSEGATIRFPIRHAELSAKDGSASGGDSASTEIPKPSSAKASVGRQVRDDGQQYIEVFTTRLDTIYGCAYIVVAPEYSLLENRELAIENRDEVKRYINAAKNKPLLERQIQDKEKTGVELRGIKAINPFTKEEVPIYVADYVLGGYGTGAVMAVPAHDERDFQFAKKYGLEIKYTIEPITGEEKQNEQPRKSIVAIIEDPETKKLLAINWGEKNGGTLFIGGGLEAGEDVLVAAKREITEETGYNDLELVSISEKIHHHYVAYSKGVNRNIEAVGLYFKLASQKRVEPILEDNEKDKFKVEWVNKEEASKRVTDPLHKYLLDKFVFNKIYVEDGILFDSGEYSGLTSEGAREKMTKWLEATQNGRRSVNYKMRDWVFSRQRYWGEPIPVVHCDKCKNKKYHYVLIHGFGGNAQEVYQPWLKAELERKGHTVFCPDLPNSDNPNIEEQVKYILDNIEINENTILVGHSLGGVVMMKLLEKLKKSVRRSVFVDPVVTPEFNDHVRPAVTASNDWKFNDQKIKKNAGEITILVDTDHPIIKKEDLEELHQRLAAHQSIKVHPGDGHFDASIEPTILEALETIGTHALAQKNLPVKLPNVKNYAPTGTGESPLANVEKWVKVKCPQCGGWAKRETNTMPNWAGSSWYYLRYIDPKNSKALVDPKKEKEWMPVSLYVGGAEHATRHLLYARFWHKFLFDIGAVSTIEPFERLKHVGLIMAEDGRKMSKRWSNVVNPDDVIQEFGADALRLYEMFMGPFNQSIAWSTEGLKGTKRFLDRVYGLLVRIDANERRIEANANVERLLHQAIKKVGDDIEAFHFNTAVSQLMILLNAMESVGTIPVNFYSKFLILLSPFAPHIAEELWLKLGNKKSIFLSTWPEYDEKLAQEQEVEFVVQVNGKVRDRLQVAVGLSETEVEKIVMTRDLVKQWLKDKKIIKKIFVPNKLVNIVVN